MVPQKDRKEGWQKIGCCRGAGAHFQWPQTWRMCDISHRLCQKIVQTASDIHQDNARLCETHPITPTPKKRLTKFTFKGSDLGCHCRLGKGHLAGRSTDRARNGHASKGFEATGIQGQCGEMIHQNQ